jgi:LPS sulfotransferase NodH
VRKKKKMLAVRLLLVLVVLLHVVASRTNFIVLSEPRSGSTLLINALGRHKLYATASELFNRGTMRHKMASWRLDEHFTESPELMSSISEAFYTLDNDVLSSASISWNREPMRFLNATLLAADSNLARKFAARLASRPPATMVNGIDKKTRAVGFKLMVEHMRWPLASFSRFARRDLCRHDWDGALCKFRQLKEARDSALANIKVVYLARRDCVSAALSWAEMRSASASTALKWHYSERSPRGNVSSTAAVAVTLSDKDIERACRDVVERCRRIDAFETYFAADELAISVTYDDLMRRRDDVLDRLSRFLIGEPFSSSIAVAAARRRHDLPTVRGRSSLGVEQRFANWPHIKRPLDVVYKQLCTSANQPSCCQHWLQMESNASTSK